MTQTFPDTPGPTVPDAPAPSYPVLIEPQQWAFEADTTESLFEAARRAGIRLPTMCRNGTCRACFSRVHSGSVVYRVERPGLSSQEKKDGYILPCVAIAQSPLVVESPLATKIDEQA